MKHMAGFMQSDVLQESLHQRRKVHPTLIHLCMRYIESIQKNKGDLWPQGKRNICLSICHIFQCEIGKLSAKSTKMVLKQFVRGIFPLHFTYRMPIIQTKYNNTGSLVNLHVTLTSSGTLHHRECVCFETCHICSTFSLRDASCSYTSETCLKAYLSNHTTHQYLIQITHTYIQIKTTSFFSISTILSLWWSLLPGFTAFT